MLMEVEAYIAFLATFLISFAILFREVIDKNPEEIKVSCLRDLKRMFSGETNPFNFGFGNRDNVSRHWYFFTDFFLLADYQGAAKCTRHQNIDNMTVKKFASFLYS